MSDIILANPQLPARVSTSADPAKGKGNLLADEHAAVAAADAGIGVGASNPAEFVAVGYTADGTRCVFRFNYKTGLVTLTP